MRKLRLLLVACIITITATAQTPVTYTQTKQIINGVEYEGSYNQQQIVITGNQLKLPQFPLLTYLYDHQEDGWSIYYPATWNNWSRQWQIHKGEWYAVSPNRKTINHGCRAVNDGTLIVTVYKQGTQHKSIGPMYE